MATRIGEQCGEISAPGTTPTICRETATHRVTQLVNYSRVSPNMSDHYVMLGYFCEAHATAKKAGLDAHHRSMLDMEARGEWHGQEPYRPSANPHDVRVEIGSR